MIPTENQRALRCRLGQIEQPSGGDQQAPRARRVRTGRLVNADRLAVQCEAGQIGCVGIAQDFQCIQSWNRDILNRMGYHNLQHTVAVLMPETLTKALFAVESNAKRQW